MKNRLSRIRGLALTIILLIGLLVPVSATPVSAGTLQWTNINLPNAASNYQLLPNSNASVYTLAPDGKTVFAYIDNFTIQATILSAAAATGVTSITVQNATGIVAGQTLIVGPMAAPANQTTTTTVVQTVAGNVLTVLPGMAIDYTSGTNVSTQGRLVKSTDGGMSWTTTNLGQSLNGFPIIKMGVSPDYATDTTVYAMASNAVYRSIDGGQTWGRLSNPIEPWPATNVYTCMDVSPYYSGGLGIMVGWATPATPGGGGGAIYTTNSLAWTPFTGAPGTYIPGDVIAVAFSPNHKTDAEMLAVVATPALGIVLQAKLGGNQWAGDILPAYLSKIAPIPVAIAGTTASIAFPSDFDWSGNNKVFIGIGNTTLAAGANPPNDFDVYRVNASPGSSSTSYDLNIGGSGTGTNISSIAFKGPLATGTLVAGLYTSRSIWRSTNAINNTPDWFESTTSPIGGDSNVALHPAQNPSSMLDFSPVSNTLYVGTKGTPSALSTSTDYNNFAAISLIAVRSAANIKVTQIGTPTNDTWYIVVRDQVGAGNAWATNDVSMLFKTTDAGNSWAMVLYKKAGSATTDQFNQIFTLPTYATDQTLYVTTRDTHFYKSTDGGASWTSYSAPNSKNINAFVLVDANTYFIGATDGGVYKTGQYTASTLDGKTVNSFLYVDASNFFAGTTDGNVYSSTDGGSTWARLGPDPGLSTPAGSVWVQRDGGYATNKTLYASNGGAAGNQKIYRWVVGTSATWEDITNGQTLAAGTSTSSISGITRSADNSLYVSCNVGNVGMWRNVNPTETASNQLWEVVGQGTNAGLTGWPANGTNSNSKVLNVSTPSQAANRLLIVATTPGSSTTNGYGYQLMALDDTLVTAPAIVAPKANAQVPPQSTFSWTPITSPVTLTYRIQISTDALFQGNQLNAFTQASSFYTSNTGQNAVDLVQGNTYYWRVFVDKAILGDNANPFASKKAAATKILIKLGTVGNSLEGVSGNRLAPIAGATNVPLRPTFQWAPVQGADSYELELADNPFFANAQAKKPLQNTVWTWDKDLTAGTTYYWRVRAVAAGTASDWVSSVFTTQTAAQAAGGGGPAISVTVPTVTATVTATPPPAPKFFDPNSGLYFNSQAELQQYQAAHPGGGASQPTPSYIWVIIIIGAILIIAVIVLIARTRRV